MDTLLHLPDQFAMHWHQWMLACLAAVVLGMSKAGIKGLGIITVTILALIFGAKASTGILVPLLIFSDIMAVIYYHRHAQWKYLIILIPWMFAGILLGVYFGKDLPEVLFKRGMAIIILLSVITMFWWEFRRKGFVPRGKGFGITMGLLAGFTTMIGNLAGAFSNLYFLAMRLPKQHFIGTAAWLFFILNLFKLPFHIWSWETITSDTLLLDLRLIPCLVLGFFAGIHIVGKINEKLFRQIVLALTACGAIAIFLK